ncbi:MAG: hypothetical protein RBQ77_00650 [Candidatus Methanomethylophilaceae archaeon]|nr:hypothetical protein [Candidatus Methanomethylophilaceae archaeon]NLF33347.1 hypothetical protein [Thermoplasmatales archaeon]
MVWDWMSFLTVIVLVFALVMIIVGIFSAYFGSGKSRVVGIVLFAVGLAVGVVWAYLTGYSNVEPFASVPLWDTIYDAFVGLMGVLIGALIALGIFLVAVMKS